MLSDFTSLIDEIFSDLSVFLSTPPVLYVVEVLVIFMVLGIFFKLIRSSW